MPAYKVLELEKELGGILPDCSGSECGRLKIKWDEDLADRIWTDRPEIIPSDIWELPLSSAGMKADEKIDQIRALMDEKKADYLFTYGELSSENLANGAVNNGMSEKQIFRSPITDAEVVGKKLLGVIKEGDVLLVKASRGIAAENVLNYVKAQLA
jgi:UDP-N-acetylmuramyl pentapeptide synthase